MPDNSFIAIGFGELCNAKPVLPIKTNGIVICFCIYRTQTVVLYHLIYHIGTDALATSGQINCNAYDFNFMLFSKENNNNTLYHVLIAASKDFYSVIGKKLACFYAEFFLSRQKYSACKSHMPGKPRSYGLILLV